MYTAASKESQKPCHVKGFPEKIGKLSFGRWLIGSLLVNAKLSEVSVACVWVFLLVIVELCGASLTSGVGMNSAACTSSGLVETCVLCSKSVSISYPV